MEGKKKIGLFWGSDTGVTQGITDTIRLELQEHFDVEAYDVAEGKLEEINNYNLLILGLSTWYDGQLQSDWDYAHEQFCELDFTNKVVALFGLGDQVGYGEYFVDGMGILGEQIIKTGGRLIGKWPTEGYDYHFSKAELEPGFFCGLALDEDCQSDMTEERLTEWCKIIIQEFETEPSLA